MDDERIVALYWARSEDAIAETDRRYGRLCRHLIGRVLASPEDREECLNDVYLTAWRIIPPQRPEHLGAFLGKIARNLALKRRAHDGAAKRAPAAQCSLEELGDCVSGAASVEDTLEDRRIAAVLDAFLRGLPVEKRVVFLRRYWWFDDLAAICARTGYSKSKVASMLHRTRRELRRVLEEEGLI